MEILSHIDTIVQTRHDYRTRQEMASSKLHELFREFSEDDIKTFTVHVVFAISNSSL
jgi:hypothetical protein